ncbi:hypothetical protein KCU65_g2755, partial [Aureobasidium melanogenum]
MFRASHSSEVIEEIDLSTSLEPRPAQNQNPHFDVQLYVLNHRQSRRNNSTVWHRDTDGSFRAVEWTSRFMYRQDREPYLDRDGQVDQEWADQKWQQWSERDYHPAVEAYNDYNEPAPEMVVLENVEHHLQSANDALEDVQIRLSQAQRTLRLSVHSSGLHNSDLLLVQTKDVLKNIFEDMKTYLRAVNEAHKESQEQLKSLELAVKALIRARTVAEKSKKKREADDEKMVDTVKFLKECLDNHCRLVNFILGRPEPLVEQGTDLIQAMLSEMFGLPVDESISEDLEPKLESFLEEEAEEESEVEVLWEKTETEDIMDVDQDDASEPELDIVQNDPAKLALCTQRKSRRLQQREKHEKARTALYERFGLSIISEPSTNQDEAIKEERNDYKRQNILTSLLRESPERDLAPKKRPALRQTTLSFNKVRKSRRLFSRKKLSQKDTVADERDAEEKTPPGSVRRYPRRTTAKRLDYRENGLFMYGWKLEQPENF